MDQAQPDPLVVPHTELSAAALRGVIESFVLREGTEYGDREFSLEQKVAQVMRQLERGEVHVIFDMDTETVDIVVARAKPRETVEQPVGTCDGKAGARPPAKVTLLHTDVRMLRAQDAQEQLLHTDVRMLRAQDAQEQPFAGGNEAASAASNEPGGPQATFSHLPELP